MLVDTGIEKMNQEQIAHAIDKLGYNVSVNEAQQYKTDEDIFKLIKTRGIIGMVVSIIDLLIDPINLFGLPQRSLYEG